MHPAYSQNPSDPGLSLMIDAFELQDKNIIEACQNTLSAVMGSDQAIDITIAAIFHLADKQSNLCHWILQEFQSQAACEEVLRGAKDFAVTGLLQKGFQLGQDFSALDSLHLVVNHSAKSALLQQASTADKVFLDSVLTASPGAQPDSETAPPPTNPLEK
ncbi:MAG: hypothetical protein HC886_00025 [Leptolyngbyaceae cyanobacterium SM1_1_3]|nr:hypothetical protein [Leptolyngbyaceae cyanobacterium SM1_1_3]NJN02032.1 hypothetical protein [Leptolyngbyaceae cyanobacterium RM1_1_2]NJO08308.1 hypothetical protein [Leptolyngbyaceae cyanobacterium SL_1_1]